jgi:hypothetical protein
MEEVKERRRGGRPKTYETQEELKEHNRIYFRNYYHEKLKGDIACQFCGTLSSSPYNMKRHVRTSKTCQRIRLKFGLTEQTTETKTEEKETSET